MIRAKAAMSGTTRATRAARRSDVPPGSWTRSARNPPRPVPAVRSSPELPTDGARAGPGGRGLRTGVPGSLTGAPCSPGASRCIRGHHHDAGLGGPRAYKGRPKTTGSWSTLCCTCGPSSGYANAETTLVQRSAIGIPLGRQSCDGPGLQPVHRSTGTTGQMRSLAAGAAQMLAAGGRATSPGTRLASRRSPRKGKWQWG
jgi:hypothetical protein